MPIIHDMRGHPDAPTTADQAYAEIMHCRAPREWDRRRGRESHRVMVDPMLYWFASEDAFLRGDPPFAEPRHPFSLNIEGGELPLLSLEAEQLEQRIELRLIAQFYKGATYRARAETP